MSEGTLRENPEMSKGSSGQDGGLCLHEGTPREDPGMSKGFSRQHGGLCLRGHQGRIPRSPGGGFGFNLPRGANLLVVSHHRGT